MNIFEEFKIIISFIFSEKLKENNFINDKIKSKFLSNLDLLIKKNLTQIPFYFLCMIYSIAITYNFITNEKDENNLKLILKKLSNFDNLKIKENNTMNNLINNFHHLKLINSSKSEFDKFNNLQGNKNQIGK